MGLVIYLLEVLGLLRLASWFGQQGGECSFVGLSQIEFNGRAINWSKHILFFLANSWTIKKFEIRTTR